MYAAFTYNLAWSELQEYRVRILDVSKCEATQRLQQGCATLTNKVELLNSLVTSYLEVLDNQVSLSSLFTNLGLRCVKLSHSTIVHCLSGGQD